MVRYLFIMFILFNSCGIPSERLNNGKGNKVPKKSYIFDNIDKIDNLLLQKTIDINYSYDLIELFESDRNFNVINDRVWKPSSKLSLQFYSNSRVRLGIDNPSPEIAGHRGIIYFKNNNLFADIFLGISSGHNTRMQIKTFKVLIKDGNLYFLETGQLSGNICRVFKKSEPISSEFKIFSADW